MTTFIIPETEASLSQLLDRAALGQRVAVTRNGRIVAEITPVSAESAAIRPEDMEWLDARRYRPQKPTSIDAGTLVSQMRDESER